MCSTFVKESQPHGACELYRGDLEVAGEAAPVGLEPA
jgi:hypothetical protein